MGMIKEFKEFAMRGNLVDTAIAFVMGAAFGKVVTAFTEGLVMPLVGLLTQGQDFTKLTYVIQQEVKEGDTVIKPLIAMKYGEFITVIIDFIIVAFVMFLVIKGINRMKKAQPAPPPAGPSNEEMLLMEIRDSLKK